MENCQKNSCHPQRPLVLLAVLLFEKFCGKYLEEAETEILLEFPQTVIQK